jgi:hypothetical protein
MNLEFIEAIEALSKEKRISKDVIFEAIESAVVSAYKKNFGTSHQNVRVEINQQTGEILAFMQMDVVEELEDEETQMTLEEAREIDDRYEIGDIITLDNPSKYYFDNENSQRGQDKAADLAVMEACRKAHDDQGIDFSRFDDDGDGEAEVADLEGVERVRARRIGPRHLEGLRRVRRREEADGRRAVTVGDVDALDFDVR